MSTSYPTRNSTVPGETSNIRIVVSDLIEFVVQTTNIGEDELHIALTEAVTNAIVHGNKKNPKKNVYATVTIKPQKIIFKVLDEGRGFNYKNLPDPTKDENLHKLHGRGLYLIRELMDEVQFNRWGNEITMVKYVN